MDKVFFDIQNRPRLKSALTIEERAKLICNLSIDQIELINQTRRYNAISIFANSNIISDNSWNLVDYKESTNYMGKGEGEQLFCECGKELKYQYIIESKDKSICKSLGLNHFIELTNLNPKVARQVKSNLTNLNLKVDEVLILLNYQYEFPEKKYKEYLKSKEFIIESNSSVYINEKLNQRLEQFSKLKLPVLSADFEDMERVINRANRIKRSNNTKNQSVVRRAPATMVIKSNSSETIEPLKIKKIEKNFVEKSLSEDKRKKELRTFGKNELKEGVIFKIHPSGTVVNLKELGYINIETKKELTEGELYRVVVSVIAKGNNIIAKRDDISEALLTEGYKIKEIRMKIPYITKKQITENGYIIKGFNKNYYVNLENGKWMNINTFHQVTLDYLYDDIRNIADFKDFMFAKRTNKDVSLVSIKKKKLKGRMEKITIYNLN